MQKEEFIREVMVHKQKLFRFALSYLGQAEEASDVVQDVLLRLWETRAKLLALRSIEAWSMTLVRNSCLDRLKRSEHKLRVYSPAADYLRQQPDQGSNPAQALLQKETEALISAALDQLPEKQRAAFQLRDVQGYSYLEISEILSIDMNQVKVNIFRARKALREALTKSRES